MTTETNNFGPSAEQLARWIELSGESEFVVLPPSADHQVARVL